MKYINKIKILFNPRLLYKKILERRGIIYNIYGTNYKKNVLISYIIHPFIYKNLHNHTNIQEALAIAEIFNSLNFNVDICKFTLTSNLDYKKYNCIFGFGNPLTNSFYQKNNSIKIYYGTGMNIPYQNNSTISRIKDVYKKKGVLLPESGRIIPYTYSEQVSFVDAMILLGNTTVAETYRKYYDGPIFTQSPSYFEHILLDDALEKNWEQAQKHFLWFGSVGAIHKGLDLLLDVFPTRPEYHLHICGLNPKEQNFIETYRIELQYPNIHNHGFVDIYSLEYKNIIKTCSYTILPSCSEAQSTSLINTMCNGLIPIITKQCGIDIQNFIFQIHTLSPNGIISVLDNLKKLTPSECAKLAQKCQHYTRQHYSLKLYKQKLMENITKIL